MAPSPKPQFVIIVERNEWTRDVYGPYRSFRRAQGDARAWGGFVEPVQKPEDAVAKMARA